MTDREQQCLLCAQGTTVEVRAFIDEGGDLVVTWWDFDPDTGSWIPDNGPKVPRQGLRGLTEMLMERL